MSLNQKEIDALKRIHGQDLWHIQLDRQDAQEEIDFVLKKPPIPTVSAYIKISQSDPLKAALVLLNDCIVHGPKDKVEDPEVVLALNRHLNSLIKVRESSIKKL
jgi:hypothetical protein